MTTDRELLEKAAKAAGYSTAHYFDGEFMGADRYEFCDGPHGWNPLTDDGDALRLAGILYLVVAVMKATRDKPAFTAVYHFNGPEHVSEPHGDDANAATRRAIVRAAANLGETK